MSRSAVAPTALLLAVAGACWAVTVRRMQGMDMGPGTDLGSLGWFAGVWLTMMAAMMLPSLAPTAVASVRSSGGTVAFGAGYLLPWAAFGVLAYALVEEARSLHLAWNDGGKYTAGGVLLAAALYELTAAKRTCLLHCRDVRLLRRRPALVMGVEQGAFCVGCSGALMAALFALGVMSIAWMLVIAALVAVEKLLPWISITVPATAGALALLGVAVMLFPEHVPWLTVPLSM
jgi:predicted metal-binding membrane protein